MCKNHICSIQGIINQARDLTILLLQSGAMDRTGVMMVRKAMLDAAFALESELRRSDQVIPQKLVLDK